MLPMIAIRYESRSDFGRFARTLVSNFVGPSRLQFLPDTFFLNGAIHDR